MNRWQNHSLEYMSGCGWGNNNRTIIPSSLFAHYFCVTNLMLITWSTTKNESHKVYEARFSNCYYTEIVNNLNKTNSLTSYELHTRIFLCINDKNKPQTKYRWKNDATFSECDYPVLVSLTHHINVQSNNKTCTWKFDSLLDSDPFRSIILNMEYCRD